MIKIYQSASDFRQGLEDRLKIYSRDQKMDLQRVRRQIAFDRYLARISEYSNGDFLLKGGYAMELLFQNARATRDIDLISKKKITSEFSTTHIHQTLREICTVDLGDFFEYEISAPQKDLINPIYGGVRFSVDAKVDKRLFVKFRLDVASDTFPSKTQLIQTKDWLQFCKISSRPILAISLEQQIAEKLHAYTLPPTEKNSRVKDLIDLVLILDSKNIDPQELMDSIDRVFSLRKTHTFPEFLPHPPQEWSIPFNKMAEECGLSLGLDSAFTKIEALLKAQESLRLS